MAKESLNARMDRMGFDPKNKRDRELFRATYMGGKITSKPLVPDTLHVGDRVREEHAYRRGSAVGPREGVIIKKEYSHTFGRPTFLLQDDHGDQIWIFEGFNVKRLTKTRRSR